MELSMEALQRRLGMLLMENWAQAEEIARLRTTEGTPDRETAGPDNEAIREASEVARQAEKGSN